MTPQTLIGEGGVAIISRRVNEMGFLYHDRRVDHGIDGEIELVGPNGEALNLVVMVQSKASNRPHTFETADSFQWTAEPADLDYWLGGNAPVIVVLSRPKDDLAWWFDVRSEFGNPRRRAERTVTINKHTQRFDTTAAAAIMGLGIPRGSGIFLPSPPKKELLTTNLLPIEFWPDTMNIAPAAVRDYTEGWRRIRETAGSAEGWILYDGMVLTFGDLQTSPLRVLCDGGIERHDSIEWAKAQDEERVHQFAELLRRTLVADRGRDVQWHQARHHLHFRATRGLSPRVVGRGPGRRGRTVFGAHYSKAEPDRVSYYHHAALKPRFRRIADNWFCQLGVDYCFTHDGKNEPSFADGLLAGIKRLDRHSAVIGWTRMWENYLQGDLFSANSPLGFGSLLTFEVDRGIDEAWWGPAPGMSAEDEPSVNARESEVDAILNGLGVDQDDLLSLLDDPPELATKPDKDAQPARRRPSKATPRTARRNQRGKN